MARRARSPPADRIRPRRLAPPCPGCLSGGICSAVTPRCAALIALQRCRRWRHKAAGIAGEGAAPRPPVGPARRGAAGLRHPRGVPGGAMVPGGSRDRRVAMCRVPSWAPQWQRGGHVVDVTVTGQLRMALGGSRLGQAGAGPGKRACCHPWRQRGRSWESKAERGHFPRNISCCRTNNHHRTVSPPCLQGPEGSRPHSAPAPPARPQRVPAPREPQGQR